jgi:hypothetical protein
MQKPLTVRSPIFVVVMDEILVATDIELIIGDLRPDARIVVSRSVERAADDTPDGRIEAAFVQSDAARFLTSTIGQRVVRDGALVILVGREPGEESAGISVLPFPFVRDDVAALLGGVMQR